MKCVVCKTPLDEKTRYGLKCPSCRRDAVHASRAKRQAEDPEGYAETVFNNGLWTKFRLRRDRYDAMLMAQKGVCAACGGDNTTVRGWHVDHDHSCCPGPKSCGECVRGILCHGCNTALGNLKDSPERLRALIQYLEFDRMESKNITGGSDHPVVMPGEIFPVATAGLHGADDDR